MRFGTRWRFAVLASLALLMSGQLCMITTCVPRLNRLQGQTAHACCHGVPKSDAPAPAGSTGAMPCDQLVSLADAPSLAAPTAMVMPVAWIADVLRATTSLAPHPLAPIQRDTGPGPDVQPPSPTGLRAPPRA